MAKENPLAIVTNDVYGVEAQFKAALTDKRINFEAEAGFALQLLQANEYTMKVALENRQSLVNAVVNVAAIGISLNPARKQAYLVPRKVNGKMAICLDISYMGMMDLALDSGSLLWVQANIVYEKDKFEINGYDKPPTHTFDPFMPAAERGGIVGAYVVAKTHSGDYLTHTMDAATIIGIKHKSEAFKKGAGPWTDPIFLPEMVKKTVVKQASKYWPKTERLDVATHYLDTNGEGLDLAEPTQAIDPLVEELLDQARAVALEGTEAYAKFWTESITKEQRLMLKDHHASLKEAAEKADADRSNGGEVIQ